MSHMWLIAMCRTHDSSYVAHMTHSYVRQDSFTCDSLRCAAHMTRHMGHMSHIWLIHMCDKTHSDVQHDAVIMRAKTDSSVRCDSITRATGRNHMCDMTHSYVQQDSFGCATYLSHYVRHDSICATWLNHKCDMPQSRAQDAPIRWTAWPIHISDMTHRFYVYGFRMTYDAYNPFVLLQYLCVGPQNSSQPHTSYVSSFV